MKIRKPIISHLVIFALLVLGGCTSHKAGMEQKADEQAVGKVIEQYIESINQCDTALARRIWSETDEVSFIAPSGYYGSYREIRDSLLVGLFGQKFKSRNLQREHLKIYVNGNNAWSEFFWTFNAIKNDGARHDTRGRETQVFKKGSDGSWRLVHIHYSTLKTAE